MKRRDVILRADMREQIDILTDEEAGMLLKSLYAYVCDSQELQTDNRVLAVSFASIRSSIDADAKRTEEVSRKRREAVKARWDKDSDTNGYKSIQTDTNEYKCIQMDTKVYNCIDNISTGGQDEQLVENTNEYKPIQKHTNVYNCINEKENDKEKELPLTTPIEKEKDKEKETTNNALALEKRKKNFYDCLVPFVSQYGKEMVREFYDYWTEPNKSRTKMRYELEKTWDIARRLRTWDSRNKSSYGTNNKSTPEQRLQGAAAIIARLAAEEG